MSDVVEVPVAAEAPAEAPIEQAPAKPKKEDFDALNHHKQKVKRLEAQAQKRLAEGNASLEAKAAELAKRASDLDARDGSYKERAKKELVSVLKELGVEPSYALETLTKYQLAPERPVESAKEAAERAVEARIAEYERKQKETQEGASKQAQEEESKRVVDGFVSEFKSDASLSNLQALAILKGDKFIVDAACIVNEQHKAGNGAYLTRADLFKELDRRAAIDLQENRPLVEKLMVALGYVKPENTDTEQATVKPVGKPVRTLSNKTSAENSGNGRNFADARDVRAALAAALRGGLAAAPFTGHYDECICYKS